MANTPLVPPRTLSMASKALERPGEAGATEGEAGKQVASPVVTELTDGWKALSYRSHQEAPGPAPATGAGGWYKKRKKKKKQINNSKGNSKVAPDLP